MPHFGIAKLVADSTGSGGPTQALGTPLYMASEQFRMDARVSPASDIYALGMVAYTLLVGAPYWKDEMRRGAPGVAPRRRSGVVFASIAAVAIVGALAGIRLRDRRSAPAPDVKMGAPATQESATAATVARDAASTSAEPITPRAALSSVTSVVPAVSASAPSLPQTTGAPLAASARPRPWPSGAPSSPRPLDGILRTDPWAAEDKPSPYAVDPLPKPRPAATEDGDPYKQK